MLTSATSFSSIYHTQIIVKEFLGVIHHMGTVLQSHLQALPAEIRAYSGASALEHCLALALDYEPQESRAYDIRNSRGTSIVAKIRERQN